MPNPRLPESEQIDAFEGLEVIPADAQDWILQFVKRLEISFVEASRHLPPRSSERELQAVSARASLAVCLDSGMDIESIVGLLGQVAGEKQTAGAGWNEALNQRRFDLIDKELQVSLTLAESIELAGLTKTMRDSIESESTLPLDGAEALRSKLEQKGPTEDAG